MLHVAHAEPRPRALFPFTSHGALMLSRCTGFPFSQDVSAIWGRLALFASKGSGSPSVEL
ncbi:DUF6193 family natural product biosynthesis protein [Streptomyces sp. NPDC059352]|uniref:DUF6193 family natural product biosynthesis protein n=1 Tax=Streptomyces sp. NPDC059352 TaxID=3346810 RepID=UPI00367E0607